MYGCICPCKFCAANDHAHCLSPIHAAAGAREFTCNAHYFGPDHDLRGSECALDKDHPEPLRHQSHQGVWWTAEPVTPAPSIWDRL